MLNIKKISCFFCVLVCFIFVNSALAKQMVNVDELKNLVNDGIKYIQEKGPEVAYKEFSKTDGKFSRNGKYLFVYDFKGENLAHGKYPEKYVGKNWLGYKDQFGELVLQNMINVAKSGEGFTGYYYMNSQSGVEEFKLAYVKAVGKDTLIGCGVFIK